MKKQSILRNCPSCGSTCLSYKPDGTILCTICMRLWDKAGNLLTDLRAEKQRTPCNE